MSPLYGRSLIKAAQRKLPVSLKQKEGVIDLNFNPVDPFHVCNVNQSVSRLKSNIFTVSNAH